MSGILSSLAHVAANTPAQHN